MKSAAQRTFCCLSRGVHTIRSGSTVDFCGHARSGRFKSLPSSSTIKQPLTFGTVVNRGITMASPSSYTLNTLSELYPSLPSFFISSNLLLLPANRLASSSPSPAVQEQLRDLVLSSQEVANSAACGSFVAGQSSESDEFGDVAVWLGEGDFGKGNELRVLEALGLEHWKTGKIRPLQISPSTGIPSNLSVSETDPSVVQLLQHLSALRDRYGFTVQRGLGSGGSVAHFVLGHMDCGDSSGWAGLLGLGVWTE